MARRKKPAQPEVLCETCWITPVEEPAIYTRCARCRYRLRKGWPIHGVRGAHIFNSKKRGRTGMSIHASNDPRDIHC